MRTLRYEPGMVHTYEACAICKVYNDHRNNHRNGYDHRFSYRFSYRFNYHFNCFNCFNCYNCKTFEYIIRVRGT